jgi:phosphohistidine swiveling domain-containing protein
MEKPNYKPTITVLHVEDEKKILDDMRAEMFKRNIYVHQVDNKEDAIAALRKCDVDFIVCDGQFPDTKGEEVKPNYIPLVEAAKEMGKQAEVIAWSNSTHVHEYNKKNNIEGYSKMLLTKERWAVKKREYIDVQLLDAAGIADLIEAKVLDKVGIDRLRDVKLESYYKESSSVLTLFMASDMRTLMFKQTAGMNYAPFMLILEDRVFHMVVDMENEAAVSDAIYNKVVNKGYFQEVRENVARRSKELITFTRSLKQMDYSGLSNKDLQSLYLKFTDLFMSMRVYSSLPTALEHGSSRWTNTLKELIKDKISDDAELNRVFSLLTTPEQVSYLKEFELGLAELGVKKQDGIDISADVEQFADRYEWINYTNEGERIDSDYVMKRISDLGTSRQDFQKILDKDAGRAEKLRAEKQEAISKYSLTEDDVEKFRIGADLVFIKFYRKGIFSESYYNMEFLLDEIAKRINCTRRQALNMVPDEVLAALELGIFPGGLIDQRVKQSVFLHADGKSHPLSYSIKDVYYHEEAVEASDTIKGEVACPGKVSGIVKIVNLPADMEKFDKGDILVSRSTNPHLVPAMQKAAAIVTEIGGLTCHAAIVSREMKTPCVVGTRIATQVLKDGDKVEVDADEGVVRVLKRC